MKPASGIPYWPSRDPIEEDGGENLYRFAGNDGIYQIDPYGLWFADGITRLRAKDDGVQLDGKGDLTKSPIGGTNNINMMHENTHVAQIQGGADPRGSDVQKGEEIVIGPVADWNAMPYKQLFDCCKEENGKLVMLIK